MRRLRAARSGAECTRYRPAAVPSHGARIDARQCGFCRRTVATLAFSITGGNRNDITQLIPLLDAVPAVAGLRGRPRRRPDCVIADRGYDHDKYRRLVWERGIKPVIARRQTEHGSGLGRYRWVVERTFAWLHNFKRLLVRYERRAEITRLSSASPAASSASADSGAQSEMSS